MYGCFAAAWGLNPLIGRRRPPPDREDAHEHH
jgi:hypothetical protein